MKVKTINEFINSNQKPEILFWVGCAGSYDDRYKKVTKSFVSILNHLRIDFAILGDEEGCTGDPARRAGNEYLFQMQALNNITNLVIAFNFSSYVINELGHMTKMCFLFSNIDGSLNQNGIVIIYILLNYY